MTDSKTEDDAGQWQARYRDLVRDFDEAGAVWRQREAELQRLLLRALRALASDSDAGTINPEQLTQLRARVETPDTQTVDELRDQVFNIANEVLEHVSTETRDISLERQSIVDLDELKELALQFVTTLSPPKDQIAQAQAYRNAIESANTRTEVAMAMLDCATWLSNVFSQLWTELGETAAYLDTLTQCLEQIDSHLNAQHARTTLEASERNLLRDNLQSQLQALSTAAQATDDVTMLRAELARTTQQMTELIIDWQETSNARQVEQDNQIAALSDALHKAQTEAETLREAVASSEMRVRLDALTGLSNRVALEERMGEELARLQRSQDTLSMLVLDIDHFKKINDTHGHLAGDSVLAALGTVLRKRLRASDFAARYGGEEFVVLLPRTDAAGAALAAEEYRRAVANQAFPLQDGPALEVTVSIGVTEVRRDDSNQSAFSRADAALYEAKSAGRNRVFVS